MKTSTTVMVVVGVGVIAGLLFFAGEANADDGGGDDSPDADPVPQPWDPSPGGPTFAKMDELAAEWGIATAHVDLLKAIARGESAGTVKIMNGVALSDAARRAGARVSNVSAAVKQADTNGATQAYNRLRMQLGECGFAASDYSAGSYGPFQQLAPFFGEHFRRVDVCIDPGEAFRLGPAMIAALRQLRGLSGWDAWDGTFGVARVGWANPSKMDEPDSAAYKKATDKMQVQLQALFGDRYSLDSKLPSFSRYTGTWARQSLDSWWSQYPGARVPK